jgi:BTB/POZ domain
MFDGHYKEKQASVIPIPNIRFCVFERMMRCIYTGVHPTSCPLPQTAYLLNSTHCWPTYAYMWLCLFEALRKSSQSSWRRHCLPACKTVQQLK